MACPLGAHSAQTGGKVLPKEVVGPQERAHILAAQALRGMGGLAFGGAGGVRGPGCRVELSGWMEEEVATVGTTLGCLQVSAVCVTLSGTSL